jgi:hypothetical protein
MNARKHTRVEISNVIRQLVSGKSPREINRGNCDEFARCLGDALEASGVPFVERCTPDDSPLPGHYWIEVYGLAYDAETPEGVSHWTGLPIFQR